jgi:hypothetical protein
MGFNRRKLVDQRREAAEKDAERLIAAWNERQAKRMPMLFSPTIGASIELNRTTHNSFRSAIVLRVPTPQVRYVRSAFYSFVFLQISWEKRYDYDHDIGSALDFSAAAGALCNDVNGRERPDQNWDGPIRKTPSRRQRRGYACRW